MLALAIFLSKPSLHSHCVYFPATSLLVRYQREWKRTEHRVENFASQRKELLTAKYPCLVAVIIELSIEYI